MSERKQLELLISESTPEVEISHSSLVSASRCRESTLVVVQGFEERSLGAVRYLSKIGARFNKILVIRYHTWESTDEIFRIELESRVRSLTNTDPIFFELNKVVGESCLPEIGDESIFVDISGCNSCLLFHLMSSLSKNRKYVHILYSEAKEYWPTKADWDEAMRIQARTNANISDLAEQAQWMFGGANNVRIIDHFEGFDHPVRCRRLLAFLSYKYSRTASIVNARDYTEIVPIVGRPRSISNKWREDVLKSINGRILQRWKHVVLPTFGYLETLKYLTENGFEGEPAFLVDGNLDIAPLGSKLQSLATWMFASVIKSCTVVTSLPEHYYKRHFSSGVGDTFGFSIRSPYH